MARKVAFKADAPVVISDRVWNGSQSWYREVVETFRDHKLRLTVRCNAYDMQSYGRVERWDGTAWHEVHSIPGEQLKSEISYVEKGVTADRFDNDMHELRRVAHAVLS